jgi:hypothetical protein
MWKPEKPYWKGALLSHGKRKYVQGIAKNNRTLEDRIKAANEEHYVFGHSVRLADNGEIIVHFQPEGLDHYHCSCLSKAQLPMSITYCFCCGGHMKHHLQNALACQLDCTVLSSARSSGGTKPCVMGFRVME